MGWGLQAVGTVMLAIVLLAAGVPAVGGEDEDGHWETLGEDGRIWVPEDGGDVSVDVKPGEDLGAYHNHTEMVEALEDLETTYPDLVEVTTIGESVEGREVLKATLTAPGDASDRARVLFDGAHHGNEVIASEILIRVLEDWTQRYVSDEEVRAMLEDVVVEVVPQVNPDGVDEIPDCDYYADCRKNANGVDLNRNYPDHWGCCGGSSGYPGSATYRGSEPLSEPESSAIAELLDENDYAHYQSLHSGAEVILWPWGWTTDRPPELDTYETFGDELSQAVDAPNGQISRELYVADGNAVDQGYGASATWDPISVTPEVYRGSGDAYNWWPLFNPPQSSIPQHVDRWQPYLEHVADEAPRFAPPTPTTTADALEPGDRELPVHLDPSPRRPLTDAQLTVDPDEGPYLVDDPTRTLADGDAARTETFTVTPLAPGERAVHTNLTAGPAGSLEADLPVEMAPWRLNLTLDPDRVTTPATSTATVDLDTVPVDEGTASVEVQVGPEEAPLAEREVDLTGPATFTAEIPAQGLPAGEATVEATAAVDGTVDGEALTGTAHDTADLFVDRPSVHADKQARDRVAFGVPTPVEVTYTNAGTQPAEDVTAREHAPTWYAWTPNPADSQPDAVERDGTGQALVFELGTLAPGEARTLTYNLTPLMIGDFTLPSAWSYEGHFDAGGASYEDDSAVEQSVRFDVPS